MVLQSPKVVVICFTVSVLNTTNITQPYVAASGHFLKTFHSINFLSLLGNVSYAGLFTYFLVKFLFVLMFCELSPFPGI